MVDQDSKAPVAPEGEKRVEPSPPPSENEKEVEAPPAAEKKDDGAEGDKEVESPPPETKKDDVASSTVFGDDGAEGDKEDGEGTLEEEKDEEHKKKFLGIPGATMPGIRKMSPPAMPKMDLKKEPEVEPPNILWKHIEAKDWNEVPAVLEGDDALDMAKEWHRQNLPLHTVCKDGKMVSDEIIIHIIDIYPDATKKRGKNRMLPLQLAVNHKCSYNVVRKLIRTYPEALDAHLSDDGIRMETTRTWVDLKRISPDVKKLLQRSTADWKVIVEYEVEQDDQHDKLISLEKKLKTAKKKQDATDRVNKTLSERVEHLESVHSTMQDFVNEIVGQKRKEMDESMEELQRMVEAFIDTQSAKNKELQEQIDESKRREIEGRSVFNGFTEDLMTLFQQNKKAVADIRESITAEKASSS